MEKINQIISEIKELLKDFPADVNTYVLLATLRDVLAPAHASLLMSDGLLNKIL